MSKALDARIRFLTPSEGGRSTPAMTGIRPHLKIGDVLTSCVVNARGAIETFEPGVEYEVTIEIPFWAEYGAGFRQDAPVELYDGNRRIAHGRWCGREAAH